MVRLIAEIISAVVKSSAIGSVCWEIYGHFFVVSLIAITIIIVFVILHMLHVHTPEILCMCIQLNIHMPCFTSKSVHLRCVYVIVGCSLI